jgi:hypothetical protein
LFLTPIDYCGLHWSHEVVIRIIRRNDGKGSENIRQGKNTAVGGWGAWLRVKYVLFEKKEMKLP